MADLMESLESQHRASHPFHRSLGISPKTRDSHIPTAPATDCFYWNETGLEKKKNKGRLHRNLDTALRTEPARLVRGSSRRITIMRLRPANIRVINRRENSSTATHTASQERKEKRRKTVARS